MRRTALSVLMVVPMFAACGGSMVRSYAAPAPADALDCSLRTMAGLGYTPIAGGKADGYIRFARSYERGMISKRTLYDHITVTSAGNQLRITAVGVDDKNKQIKATEEGLGHAQAIISGCSNPQQTS
jgi:hypothetical protein